MKQILEDSAWKKTLQLIEEKYGKTLQFRALKLLNDQKKTAYSHGDNFIIPLSLKNHDLGNIIINRGSFLSDEQKSEIVDLIKFLVEPQVYNLHLKTTEQNILNQKDNSERESRKVVKLYADLDDHEENRSKKLLSQIIHLKSHTPQTRHKVALKIHEMSERNLFVRLNDIINTTTTAEEILSLSDTTIYIEDIEMLSATEVHLLERFLTLLPAECSDSCPVILVGSCLLMESLSSKPWSIQLKNDLSGFYFDIDRVPLVQQTSHEILDLLFFEVNESMS